VKLATKGILQCYRKHQNRFWTGGAYVTFNHLASHLSASVCASPSHQIMAMPLFIQTKVYGYHGPTKVHLHSTFRWSHFVVPKQQCGEKKHYQLVSETHTVSSLANTE